MTNIWLLMSDLDCNNDTKLKNPAALLCSSSPVSLSTPPSHLFHPVSVSCSLSSPLWNNLLPHPTRHFQHPLPPVQLSLVLAQDSPQRWLWHWPELPPSIPLARTDTSSQPVVIDMVGRCVFFPLYIHLINILCPDKVGQKKINTFILTSLLCIKGITQSQDAV